MADFCRQCGNETVFLVSRPVGPFNYGLLGMVEAGHLFSCACAGCGPTVVDHRGWCLGRCSKDHGDLPVPFTEVTVADDYRLA